METKTVTIGDSEVEIRETEDGFEAEEVPTGLHIRVESKGGKYGFEIPLELEGENFVLTARKSYGDKYHSGRNPLYAEWDTDVDISDLKDDGIRKFEVFGDVAEDFDGHAAVTNVEFIDYDEE